MLLILYSLPKTIEIFLRSFEHSNLRPLEFRSTPSGLFSLRLMIDRSKLESLRDVSVTRIGDTLSHGFPQTVYDDLRHHHKMLVELRFVYQASVTQMRFHLKTQRYSYFFTSGFMQVSI